MSTVEWGMTGGSCFFGGSGDFRTLLADGLTSLEARRLLVGGVDGVVEFSAGRVGRVREPIEAVRTWSFGMLGLYGVGERLTLAAAGGDGTLTASWTVCGMVVVDSE